MPIIVMASIPSAVADRDSRSDDGDNSVEGSVEQTITIDGTVIPGGSTTTTTSIPARCWWDPFEGTDDEFINWYVVNWTVFPVSRFFLPTPDEVQDAIDKGEDTPGQWYMASCVDDATADDYDQFLGACQEWYPHACIPRIAGWYADTEGEPPVIVQPGELALAAQALIEIPDPEVDQNPKLAGTENTTLVNVDTGFWVTDPDAVGGNNGVHEVRATIPETGVWVEINATTDGLQIASEAGSTSCTPVEATTAWTPGTDPACSVAFNRASTNHADGYPVTVSSSWNTGWRGGIGDTETDNGTLDPITTDTTVNIPVAEAQTVVND